MPFIVLRVCMVTTSTKHFILNTVLKAAPQFAFITN